VEKITALDENHSFHDFHDLLLSLMMKSIHHSASGNSDCENHLFGHGVLENQIQALSRTIRHRFKTFKDHACFQGLSRPWKPWKKNFRDFKGPARALFL